MSPSKIVLVCSRNIRDFWERIDLAVLSSLVLVVEFSLFVPCSLPLPPFRQTPSNKSDNFSNNVRGPEVHVTHCWSRRATRRPSTIHANQTSPKARVSHIHYPSRPKHAYDSYQKKKASSIWDFIKHWSFFGSNKDTDNEESEPTPEPPSPADAPPSLQDIITRRKTASPKLHENQEVIIALQAKATKNLYERGLEVCVQSLVHH